MPIGLSKDVVDSALVILIGGSRFGFYVPRDAIWISIHCLCVIRISKFFGRYMCGSSSLVINNAAGTSYPHILCNLQHSGASVQNREDTVRFAVGTGTQIDATLHFIVFCRVGRTRFMKRRDSTNQDLSTVQV